MPRRAKIATLLPQELRKELNTKMIANAFAGYTPLSEWLAGHGYKISKSSIHRYGRKLESRMEAVGRAAQQACAIVEVAPDEEGAMNEALMRLVQKRLFDVLMEDDSLDTAKLDIGEVATMVVTIGRASIDQKKFAQEVRAQAAIKLRKARAEPEVPRNKGIPPEVAQKIRNALRGPGV